MGNYSIHQKFIPIFLVLISFMLPALSQNNGCNSSYSRFGLGTLNDQSQGFNKNMGGVALGMRAGNRLNMQNPASYSAIDSLTFLLDVGMNASMGRIKMGGNSMNVNNCSFDYANIGFRLARGLGFSAGFYPLSTIGYKFSSESKVTQEYTTTQDIKSQCSYAGDGGMHQVFAGIGWKPWGELSIGANVSYIWGKYNHQLSQTFTEGGSSTSSYSGLYSTNMAQLKTYKIDLGAQYSCKIDKENHLIVGVTAGLGHNIKSDATLTRYTGAGDSLQIVAPNAFDLPYSYGIGLAWEHEGKLEVGADVVQEQWAKCKVPTMKSSEGLTYIPEKGSYKNRTRIAIGTQYLPDNLSRRYLKRMYYRIGVNYSTPYLMVNGQDGPSEYALTAGVGLPISNNINKGTIVNVGVQWMRRNPSVSQMITENYFMLNLGVTVNERWFMKFKIQ